MSRNHSPSQFPARDMGPRYCLFCGSDWPCAGSRMEAADHAAPAPTHDPEKVALALISTAMPTAADIEAARLFLAALDSAEKRGHRHVYDYICVICGNSPE